VYIDQENGDETALLAAYNARNKSDLMLKVLLGIKAAELETSLMLLPVSYVRGLLPILHSLLETYPLATELALKVLTYLMRFHWATLSSSDKAILRKLTGEAEQKLRELTDTVGFNIAGLRFIDNVKKEKDAVEQFREIVGDRNKKRKRKEKALRRAVLSMNTA